MWQPVSGVAMGDVVAKEWRGEATAWKNKAAHICKKRMQLASHRYSPTRTSPLHNQHSYSPCPMGDVVPKMASGWRSMRGDAHDHAAEYI